MRNCALGRGIQYPALLEFDHDGPGVLDRPPSRAMTTLELMTLKDTEESIP
jgi:hypothetical protein